MVLPLVTHSILHGDEASGLEVQAGHERFGVLLDGRRQLQRLLVPWLCATYSAPHTCGRVGAVEVSYEAERIVHRESRSSHFRYLPELRYLDYLDNALGTALRTC